MMTEGKAHAAYGTKEYPSHPVKVSYGMALVASEDLPAGTVVEKLEGPQMVAVDYESLSDYDKTYALTYQAKGSDEWTWDVRKGEQITFLYNPQGDVEEPWDPIWTFTVELHVATALTTEK
ncbi:hypothetical protein HKX48_006479 [Thoreauomyces humboldtii]|nr:hypothetical protein HKX48_006479 [Thoreauomyces humboldtii]